MPLLVNQRSYPLPQTPVVVVCVDGGEPDYIAQAVATGHMPWMKKYYSRARLSSLTAWSLHSPTPITCLS